MESLTLQPIARVEGLSLIHILCLRALQHRNGDAGGRKTNMSALRKCRMVEGQPGETAYLTANMSVLLRQADRFCCVTAAAFYRRRVLAIADRVTE